MKQSSDDLQTNEENKTSQEHVPEEKKETNGNDRKKGLNKQEQKKLDMMHAFGAYSGEKDFDVYG